MYMYRHIYTHRNIYIHTYIHTYIYILYTHISVGLGLVWCGICSLAKGKV